MNHLIIRVNTSLGGFVVEIDLKFVLITQFYFFIMIHRRQKNSTTVPFWFRLRSFLENPKTLDSMSGVLLV